MPSRGRPGSTTRWRRTRSYILARDRWVCALCGDRATVAGHIVPKVSGGSDEPWNLRAECWRCSAVEGGRLTSRDPTADPPHRTVTRW